jgi:putative acetyltransferase
LTWEKDMIIRSAKLSDRDKIALTHKASIETLCARHYSAQQIAKWMRIISSNIYENAIQAKIMIVAVEDEKILGLGILDVEIKEICAVYVHPKAVGTGVGKKILAKLEQRALEYGLDHLALGATVNALGFYKKHGYCGDEIGFHVLPDGTKLKCIRLQKELNNN